MAEEQATKCDKSRDITYCNTPFFKTSDMSNLHSLGYSTNL